MRVKRPVALLFALGLLIAPVGCSTQITGVPQAASGPVPLAIAQDGFGIVAGFEDAPARIEIFTEPQCTHCGDLQHDFGDEIAYNLTIGTLQVTYRPLTFLDDGPDGYSAKVANALFLSTEAIDNYAATGTQFQRFVEELWINQDPGGPVFTGDELREMAVAAGIPEAVADHLANHQEGIDVAEMEDANYRLLLDVDSVDTGTPTGYDLEAGEKLDLTDADWLDNLVSQ